MCEVTKAGRIGAVCVDGWGGECGMRGSSWGDEFTGWEEEEGWGLGFDLDERR